MDPLKFSTLYNGPKGYYYILGGQYYEDWSIKIRGIDEVETSDVAVFAYGYGII